MGFFTCLRQLKKKERVSYEYRVWCMYFPFVGTLWWSPPPEVRLGDSWQEKKTGEFPDVIINLFAGMLRALIIFYGSIQKKKKSLFIHPFIPTPLSCTSFLPSSLPSSLSLLFYQPPCPDSSTWTFFWIVSSLKWSPRPPTPKTRVTSRATVAAKMW